METDERKIRKRLTAEINLQKLERSIQVLAEKTQRIAAIMAEEELKKMIATLPREMLEAFLRSSDLTNKQRRLVVSAICESISKFDGEIILESIEDVGNKQ
jgi:F0F1-type ATP synthase delta subunit